MLDEIGKYVHPEYLVRFLSDPHGTKPGTLMPDVLGQLPPGQRDAAVLALANFLASTGTVTERGSDMQSAARGATLFSEVGCLACHSAPDPTAAVSATSRLKAPLIDPSDNRPTRIGYRRETVTKNRPDGTSYETTRSVRYSKRSGKDI